MILESINNENDIKKLNIKELEILAGEVREKILEVIKKNGGHLSSNLGIVELTIALHYVFDFPLDKLIFDVGHQCYTHKLLTRKDRFDSIRTDGGISGFPSISESEYDSFGVGHAGTSIAAGLGYCYARDAKDENYKVISVIGDGSIINGLSLEAITASSEKPKNFLVILNDNGMSIAKNNNGLYKSIAKVTTKKSYNKLKKNLRRVFGNSFVTKGMIRFRNFWKRIFIKNSYFEQFGFKYYGIIDGHDIKELVSTLKIIKNSERPILLHVETKKGKGYADAEKESEKFHGVSKNMLMSVNDFSNRLGNKLVQLAIKDDKIFAITAGMKEGTGLNIFESAFPDRFLDVGISEEYAVTLASGMSVGGLKPVVAIYSTFMQRAYDEILHDVCLQNLGVVFCLDRAGLVGYDGQTHQGVFDLSYLIHIPNITIMAPVNINEFDRMLEYAIGLGTPVAIRYPNGISEKNEAIIHTPINKWSIEYGNIEEASVIILAVGGRTLNIALESVNCSNKNIAVINARTVKPLDKEILEKIKNKKIITLEENSEIGGFGAYVTTYYSSMDVIPKIKIFGIKDKFVKHGNIGLQLENNSITKEDLVREIEK